MAERHELLARLLQAVNKELFDQVKDLLAKYGLPAASMITMRQIKEEQGITVSELARRTGLAKSHVSKTIDLLASQGFVEKRPDPADQRLIRLHTTELARQHFDQMHGEIRERLAQRVAAMPEGDVDTLIEGLQTLHRVLGQK